MFDRIIIRTDLKDTFAGSTHPNVTLVILNNSLSFFDVDMVYNGIIFQNKNSLVNGCYPKQVIVSFDNAGKTHFILKRIFNRHFKPVIRKFKKQPFGFKFISGLKKISVFF